MAQVDFPAARTVIRLDVLPRCENFEPEDTPGHGFVCEDSLGFADASQVAFACHR